MARRPSAAGLGAVTEGRFCTQSPARLAPRFPHERTRTVSPISARKRRRLSSGLRRRYRPIPSGL
jgi:hypothetical protein